MSHSNGRIDNYLDETYGPRVIGSNDGDIDPAELPEIYRALQEAEVRGNVGLANRLEALIEEWVDAHTDEEVEEWK